MRIESNNGGRIFSIGVRKDVKSKAPLNKCVIQARPTTKNKGTRILMKSGWVKKHAYFLHESEYRKGSGYDRFMKGITGYKKEGGNKHDDAPDSITILAEFFDSLKGEVKAGKKKVARGTGAR